MPVVARTRFLAGRQWCEVRTYEIYGRSLEVVARFSIGSIDGLDVCSADRCIDCVRKVQREAERIKTAGRSNTGRCLMGENFRPFEGHL